MYLVIEDNPNCAPDERVFSEKSEQKVVKSIHYERDKSPAQWWDVIGVDENNQFIPAKGVLVEDSGAGLAWLIFGGVWGLRFKPQGDPSPWSLDAQKQWGAPFKVLDSSGADIHFVEPAS